MFIVSCQEIWLVVSYLVCWVLHKDLVAMLHVGQ